MGSISKGQKCEYFQRNNDSKIRDCDKQEGFFLLNYVNFKTLKMKKSTNMHI